MKRIQLTGFTSWFPGTIHRDLHAFRIHSDLRRTRTDSYHQIEALAWKSNHWKKFILRSTYRYATFYQYLLEKEMFTYFHQGMSSSNTLSKDYPHQILLWDYIFTATLILWLRVMTCSFIVKIVCVSTLTQAT